jgi:hypothetical protein
VDKWIKIIIFPTSLYREGGYMYLYTFPSHYTYLKKEKKRKKSGQVDGGGGLESRK